MNRTISKGLLMKKKEKTAPHESRDSLDNVDLRKYCPQKIFNVLFINEADEHSRKVTQKILQTSKDFQDISFLTFITYDDVIDLLTNYENVTLPPSVKLILAELVTNINKQALNEAANLSEFDLAKLMKVKLIEVMYTSYVKTLTNTMKRRKLEADLHILTNECLFGKRDAGKPNLIPSSVNSRTTPNKITSKFNLQEESIDYTDIPIESNDDIIFDDDIHHQISYYIFQGFHNTKLLKQLIVDNNVWIQAIIKVVADVNEGNSDTQVDNSLYSDFWDKINMQFAGPEKRSYLENTFLMNFNSVGKDPTQILEELLHVVRCIADIKLLHLNYIRSMAMYQVKETYNYYPLECFTVYNRLMNKLPAELINIPIILDSLLKQTCVGLEEKFVPSGISSQQSCMDSSSFEKTKCINPCSFDAFFKHKILPAPASNSRTHWTSFLANEKDELTFIRNSYKKYGPLVCETSIKVLKNLKPLQVLTETEPDCREIIHKHDRDPSTKTVVQNEDVLLHFLYIFLFSCFGHKDSSPKQVENDLTKILEIYDISESFKCAQVKLIQPSSQLKVIKSDSGRTNKSKSLVSQVSVSNESHNLYKTAPVEYYWKEKLETTTLLQEVFKAHNSYMYCEYRYSPETDNLLIQFTNSLDEFGINTRVYEEYLATPICLRDFCRYTVVNQADWLDRNKPPKYVRKCFANEVCQGAGKVKNLDLFPDYHYLLKTQAPEPAAIDLETTINDISFEELVEEIRSYPRNKKIVREILKSEKQKSFHVYDIGINYCKVNGAKTIFYSHDGVALSVDNGKLLNEHPKCSLVLECGNTALVVHSNICYSTEDFSFFINLPDNAIVSFIFYKPKKRKSSQLSLKESLVDNLKVSEVDETINYTETVSPDIVQVNKVLSVDKNYFESMINTKLLNEEFTSSTEIPYRPSESMLESLKQAVTSNVPIYKVNTNKTHLKTLKSEFEIPLVNIVNRFMHSATEKEETRTYNKRYLPMKGRKLASETKRSVDMKISLPNGLYLTMYPSKLKGEYMEVKQEYLYPNSFTEQEEFRLFTRGGYILIKKIDGSVLILRPNGDTVTHEDLDTDSDQVRKWSLKPRHCKNVADYQKRVSKLFKKTDDDVPQIGISRRGIFHLKKGRVVGADTTGLLEKNKVPYLKSTLLKFDGDRISLKSGKLCVRKVMHVTLENNFYKQEKFYERTDGCKKIFDRFGRQLVEFPDGTAITSTLHVAKDLVDGYVYISLEFKFEHPSYVTVVYNASNALEITLPNKAVIKKEAEDLMTVNIDDCTTTVVREKIVFEKSCTECNSKYTCDINISPLASGKIVYSDEFVHARDSYNKHFYSDFAGNCKRNQDYLKGAFNAAKCNHYSKMSYKKLFVVNRDFSGQVFWTDNMAAMKRKAMQEADSCSTSEYKEPGNSNVEVFKFKKIFFDHYCDRFLNKSLSETRQEAIYSTFCVIRRMLNNEIMENFFQNVRDYLSRNPAASEKLSLIVDQIISEKDESLQKGNEDVVITTVEDLKQPYYCKCLQERITMSDKIRNWKTEYEKYRALIRNKKIPGYFHSNFCQIIKRK